MGSTISLPKDVHFVIVGGGYGGCQLALDLMNLGCKFTLIDAKDFMHHCVASVRTVVKQDYAKKCCIPYKGTFGDHFVQGIVVGINHTDKIIELENGESVAFDIAVLATGSKGPLPFKNGLVLSSEEYVTRAEAIHVEVFKAKSVTVVGGGAVGVEVAAEIAERYPDKNVTLVHNKELLVGRGMSEEFYERLDNYLRQLNIDVIKGQRAINLGEFPSGEAGDYTLRTDQDTLIHTNLILKATGVSIHKDELLLSLGDKLNENGRMRVNEFFQVDGFTHIFALGDVCDTEDLRLAYVAKEQAKHLIKNLELYFTNKPMKPWVPNKLSFKMAVSIGSRKAIGERGNGKLAPEFLVVKLKAQDLMVGNQWEQMKQKPPK